MSERLEDFPPGPLDYYRKKASFDWKKLKTYISTEEIVKYETDLLEEIRKQPDYHKNLLTPTFDEERHIASRQSFIYKGTELVSLNYVIQNLKRPAAALRIMIQLAPSSTVKHVMGSTMFVSVMRSMGTERHAQFIDDAEEGNIYGCYCLTEIGHGTNTKGMRTTATYDKETKQFIMNTPDFEAAKCWAGSLGQTASYALVFAQLYVDNKHHGLNAFIVKIRDPKTLLPCPGVTVGDMGEKIGLNGIDNGFLIFNQYRIPRENLLNKIGDVTESGEYVTAIRDASKRHGASLGALSAGRVSITTVCESLGVKALTIAIRYAGVRRQFGPEGKEEIPILEYQTHQHRLLPYLAAAYVIRNFGTYLSEVFYQYSIDSLFGNNKESLPDLGMEIHAVSSASKPISGWTMRDAIQECRETCGGHGYLKASGIGDIRNDHDANLTYEGENHVLIQQTTNWLLKMWPAILKREKITTPLQSANFLSNGLDILQNAKFTANTIEEFCQPESILQAFQWLVCYLLKQTSNKCDEELKNGQDPFFAKNDSQVFYGKNMAIAYIQHFLLQRMLVLINEASDPSIKNVLLKLFSLYGVWSLQKHLPTLYQGQYGVGEKPTTIIQGAILRLCGDLKNDAVSLIDTIAPPDFILDSVLGASDGMVYHNLQSAIYRSPFALSRPKWWQDIVYWKQNVKPKL